MESEAQEGYPKTFAMGSHAPRCACGSADMQYLSGNVPEELCGMDFPFERPQATLEFEASGICPCKKLHRYRVHVRKEELCLIRTAPIR